MKIAIAHLGRSAGMGEARRLWSWTAAAEAAGFTVVPVPLLADHGTRVPRPRGLVAVGAGRAVPESLAWSPASVRDRLASEGAEAVVCLTARAYRPSMAPAGTVVVLDFVDRLSVSYRDRSAIARGAPRRIGFRLLAAAHRRFERVTIGDQVRRVAAGRHDASLLGAEWVPNLVAVVEAVGHQPADDASDVLFFGNLAYPPNVAAVHRLAALWPALQARRPDTTALLAGAQPTHEVRRLAAARGWEVAADFDDLATLAAGAKLAVAPLVHTAGIQNKVLEAAALGMAQVITTAAAAGLDADFPVAVVADDASFVEAVAALLDDGAERRRQGETARAHVRTMYSPSRWAEAVARLVT